MAQSIDDARRRHQGAAGARVPPHNLQAEESLLGAMLLSRDAIVAAVEVQLSAEDFYKPAHGHIFDAITSLYAQGEPADPVTVSESLSRAGVLDAIGGPGILISLQAGTPAVGNAGRYARIIEEHSLLRRLIRVAGDIAEMGYGLPDDVAATVDEAEAMVFDVAQRRVTDSMATIRDLLSAQLDHLEALFERNQEITGVPTGFIDLDKQLAGLQPSNLVIIGGRPGTGKTSFALGIAAHAALEARTPVLVFSLEMSHRELTQRLLCSEARVDATRMRNGKLLESDWPKISHAVGRLGEAQLFIDDNPHLTVMEIRAKARRLKSREGLGLIIIDYMQLMSGRSNAENRQVEVSEMSRGLKILARELNVPVIALSQLSRNLESRADKRPVLADLRESGCMPATTRLLRADNGDDVSLGELVLSQEQPVVWSIDEHRRLVLSKLVKAFPSGVKPVFRLRLASGRSVDATANHKFLTDEGWARLDSLVPGSSVAVPSRLPEPLQPGAGWSDDEISLLAHMIGAGSIGPSFTYTTADPADKDVVEGLARRVLGVEAQADKVGSTWRLSFPSPYRLTDEAHHPMRNWLEPHGLWPSPAWTRFVPRSVFGLTDAKVSLFLRHLWATGGSIPSGGNDPGRLVAVDFATTSRRLALDVQRLLLRLGVRSTIGMSKEVPSGRPDDGIQPYRERYSVRIEGAGDEARFLRAVGTHSRQGDRIGLDGVTPAQSAAEASDPIAAADLDWDEVIEITPLGMQPTFDATVAGTHNFVADGVVAHNSLEQDADVVVFLYRDEVYNRDTPDRGTAEVIVAKHRNGPIGVTHLAFLDHYTRFANMARV